MSENKQQSLAELSKDITATVDDLNEKMRIARARGILLNVDIHEAGVTMSDESNDQYGKVEQVLVTCWVKV